MDLPADRFGAEAPLIQPGELTDWIVYQDDGVIALNKPGWLVCHPSKNGPWSSLVGTAREELGLDNVHLVSRLDRETSGLVILAKDKLRASRLQRAVQDRRVQKLYLAVLKGELTEPVHVNKALIKDKKSPIVVKQMVKKCFGAQTAKTDFFPLLTKNGYTFAAVRLHTGRKHQIRVHAHWLGYPIVGDKLYGPDEMLYLEFIENGWTEKHEGVLEMKRQALHAWTAHFTIPEGDYHFEAPLPADIQELLSSRMDLDAEGVLSLLRPIVDEGLPELT